MKKMIQLMLFVFLGQLSFSQTATLEATKSLRSSKNYFVRNILDNKQGGFHAITIPNSDVYKSKDYVYVDYIDSTLTRTTHKILNLKEGNVRLRYEYLLEKEGKLWLFCSYMNKKTKKNSLYVQEINRPTWERKGELKHIIDIDFSSVKAPGQFHFTHTTVGNDFIVFAQNPKSNAEGIKVKMLIISPLMVVEDTQMIKWNTTVGSLKFKNVFYDGNGNLVFFARNLISLESVFYYRSNKNDAMKKIVVSANGKSIADVEAYWDKTGITCHGLYKETMDGSVSGVFTVDFKKGEFINYQEDAFFTPAKKSFSPGNSQEIWKNLTLKKIVNRGKGLDILVCEQSNDYTVAYQTYNQSSYYGGGYYGGYGGYYSTETVDYESFNNIVLIAVKDGKEIWRKLIPKKQQIEASVAYWGSVAINSNDKGLFLYFNSSVAQSTEADGVASFTGGKQYALTEVFINNEGIMKRVEVYRGNSNTREIPVISSFYFDTKNIIFQGRKGTSTKFYKLQYRD